MHPLTTRIPDTFKTQEFPPAKRRHTLIAITLLFVAGLIFSLAAHASYIQTNLVSDGSVSGTTTDPNLINPWGMVASTTSPFWVSDNGSGVSTLYNGSGTPQGLVVTIPPPSGGTSPSRPTGLVFNAGTGFQATPGQPARFIFATEDGTISGWPSGTTALLEVDNSTSGANYKGLAIGASGANTFLYAANFSQGKIDIFDTNFAPTALGGSFTDPNLPAGYAPFNIQNIGGELYVTYALQDGTGQNDIAGPGNGFVDVFDTNGNFLRRLVSTGPLNSPWGLALAPLNFGTYSSALLVGNSGDGLINAFDLTTGTFLGSLDDALNNPLAIDGLWGLSFGNGGNGGQSNELFFTAGPNNGANGLFGKITSTSTTSVPEPTTLGLFGIGIMALLKSRSRAGRKNQS
jgi:uncharacterized protein (TIGR03118 family)